MIPSVSEFFAILVVIFYPTDEEKRSVGVYTIYIRDNSPAMIAVTAINKVTVLHHTSYSHTTSKTLGCLHCLIPLLQWICLLGWSIEMSITIPTQSIFIPSGYFFLYLTTVPICILPPSTLFQSNNNVRLTCYQ